MFRRKGFTLLELIIVIIVIGILASLALPRYTKLSEKARTAEAKSALGAVRSAQSIYFAQYGTYTGTVADLAVNFTEGRFFGIPTAVAGTSNTLGYIVRGSRDAAAPYQGYTYFIMEDGTINCTPSTACPE